MQEISNEEKNVLVRGFIKFVFDEMHLENWTSRRKELRERFQVDPEEGNRVDDRQQPTFPEMMEIHQFDLDKVLHIFFCREIMSYAWFESFCIQLNPIWDKRDGDAYCYWTFDSILYDWFYQIARDMQERGLNVLFELKEILDLNLSLK